MKKTIINICYPIIVLLAVLLVWLFLSLLIDVELILPSPKTCFREILSYIKSSEFYINLGYSVLRVIEAFLISFVVAFILALLSKTSNIALRLFRPLMSIIRGIPTMAIILILIIWLSPSRAPIWVSFIVISPILYSNIYASINEVDKNVIEMANIYKVSKFNQIRKIYVPSSIKPIIESVASNFSLTFKLVIASEAMALTTKSIGKMMQYDKIWLETGKLFALTVICVVIGSLSEFLIRLIASKFVRWNND